MSKSGKWLKTYEYDPKQGCPVCKKRLETEEAVYQAPCDHIFHNKCLNDQCDEEGDKTLCPVCHDKLGYSCMDVYAFENEGLDENSALFTTNEDLYKKYKKKNGKESKSGGKKRKINKRTTRRGGKKRTTRRRRKTSRKFK